MLLGTSLSAECTGALRFLPWRRIGGAWVRFLRDDLARRRSGILIENHSVWGQTSADALSRLPRTLADSPDQLLLELAINDADRCRGISLEQSRQNLENLVRAAREDHPGCALTVATMSICTGRHAEQRPELRAYYQAHADVAQRAGLGLIDLAPRWEALLRDEPERFARYVPDGIHPNAQAGCEWIAPACAGSLAPGLVTRRG